MSNLKQTPPKHKKTFEKEFELNKNQVYTIKFRNMQAVVLYPALGNPAIIKGKDDVSATLEILVLCKRDNLQRGEAAFHLRYAKWGVKEKTPYYHDDSIWKNYIKDKESVVLSKAYEINDETFGEGEKSSDAKANDGFTLKFGNLNVFPWVLEGLKKYGYLYKVSIDLKDTPPGMYNIWWVTKKDYKKTKNRPYWWDYDQHFKDFTLKASDKKPFKNELKKYGKVDDKDNIKVSIYHPFYITTKEQLNIGHVTDVHMDSRMDIYGQSEASVIEVEENCKGEENGERKIENKDYFNPIKSKIANFNKLFTELCEQLFFNKADAVVITGDLVDYNRGVHAKQTHKKCFTKISEQWEALSSDVDGGEYYQDDRNWLTFYKRLLDLYDDKKKPLFTMLGNHDYVRLGQAPWPLNGFAWNGVFDQNLTLYESALCFGPGHNDSEAFLENHEEQVDFVEWYTIFINPFADFVVDYGNQSMLMADWGVESDIAGSEGGLHNAEHLFEKKAAVSWHALGVGQPYPIKNLSIYRSFKDQQNKIKMLFMHATALCPRDDVTEGEVNNDLQRSDDKLSYGSFNKNRANVLNDVENGKVNMIISGHSHRNMVMEVKAHYKPAKVLGAGETFGTIKRKAEKMVMVTSSAGPLPKYLPGGPKICACTSHFNDGWDFKKRSLSDRINQYPDKIYRYDNKEKKLVKTTSTISEYECPKCHMRLSHMKDKPSKRHKPGASLLKFDNENVTIETILCSDELCKPRLGPMSDEHEVFTEDMELEDVASEQDFSDSDDTKPLKIISRAPFIKYGDMDFPYQVEYVTYLKQQSEDGSEKFLRGGTRHPVTIDKWPKNRVKIKQGIGTGEFERLMNAGQKDNDFAFTRYIFKNNEKWDREIKMTKGLHKNKLTKEDYNSLDEYQLQQQEQMVASPNPSIDQPGMFEPRSKYPFKNLVIKFLRRPDLKKREDVCGY